MSVHSATPPFASRAVELARPLEVLRPPDAPQLGAEALKPIEFVRGGQQHVADEKLLEWREHQPSRQGACCHTSCDNRALGATAVGSMAECDNRCSVDVYSRDNNEGDPLVLRHRRDPSVGTTSQGTMETTTQSESFTVVATALEAGEFVAARDWIDRTTFVTPQGIEVRKVRPSLMPTFVQLTDKMMESVAQFLDASTPEEAVKLLIPSWKRFMELLTLRDAVARELTTQGDELPSGVTREFVVDAAGPLGEDARRALEFATTTFFRAERVARRIKDSPSEENVARDEQLRQVYWRASGMHIFGVSALLYLAERYPKLPTWKGILTCAVIRDGAMSAFAAATEASRLRPIEPRRHGDRAFDSEDAALANWDG